MQAYTYEKSHRVTTDITYIQQETGAKKWKDKIPKALFRGRDSNEGRLTLAMWNRSEPLLDAGITRQESKYLRRSFDPRNVLKLFTGYGPWIPVKATISDQSIKQNGVQKLILFHYRKWVTGNIIF